MMRLEWWQCQRNFAWVFSIRGIKRSVSDIDARREYAPELLYTRTLAGLMWLSMPGHEDES